MFLTKNRYFTGPIGFGSLLQNIGLGVGGSFETSSMGI